VKQLATLVERDDWPAALARALELWRAAPCAALADLVGAIAARVEPAPALRARKASDYQRQWLALCADAAGADVVGEKSPLHTEHAGRLASMFPGARFVQMVRDPRDVALSQTSIWERTALQSAWRWRVDQKLAIEHGRAIGADRFRVQRYEDLVADPEGSLRAISSFLSIPYDGAMLDPSSREGSGFAAHETHKLQTLERVSTGRIGRYKGRLAARDIGVVQAVCAPLMTHFGYGLEPIPRWRGLCGAALQVVPTLLGRFRASRRKRDRLDRAADIAP